MTRRQLRVGVDQALTRLNPNSGHGRVWRNVLGRLERIAVICPYDDVSGPPSTGRADVVLADGHRGAVSTDLPVVAQVHEASWDDASTRDTIDPRFREHIAAATAASVAAATMIITAADSAKQQIVSVYDLAPERVSVVPHGVDARLFRPRRARAGRKRAEVLLGTGRPYLMYAGTVHPRKNLPVLRDAMAKVVAGGADVCLLLALSVAHDRPDSSQLLAAARSELDGAPGRVAVVDRPDDELADLMAGCAVFCLPSGSEGFGLTALEAMACGSAVVVANRGALPEVVGSAGVCAEPTRDQLAEAIGGLLTDPDRRAAIGRAARRRAKQLSWRHTAIGWHQVLEHAVETGR